MYSSLVVVVINLFHPSLFAVTFYILERTKLYYIWPFQQIKANRQETRVKVTAKKTVHSVFGVPLLSFLLIYRSPGLPEHSVLI